MKRYIHASEDGRKQYTQREVALALIDRYFHEKIDHWYVDKYTGAVTVYGVPHKYTFAPIENYSRASKGFSEYNNGEDVILQVEYNVFSHTKTQSIVFSNPGFTVTSPSYSPRIPKKVEDQ